MLRRGEEGIKPLGNGVTDGRETPCVCWELNLGPLYERVLLTAEPALQPSDPDPLLKDSTVHSGLGPPRSTSNQRNPPEMCPQASFIQFLN